MITTFTCDLSYFNSILSTHVALTRVVKHVKIRRQWQSTPERFFLPANVSQNLLSNLNLFNIYLYVFLFFFSFFLCLFVCLLVFFISIFDLCTCFCHFYLEQNNPYFVWILRTVLNFSKSRGQASFRKGKNVKRFPYRRFLIPLIS